MQQHLKQAASERGYYAAEDTGEYLAENPHAIARDQPTYFVKLYPHLSFQCSQCGYTGSRAHPAAEGAALDAEGYYCPNTACKERIRIQPMVDAPTADGEERHPNIDDWATL